MGRPVETIERQDESVVSKLARLAVLTEEAADIRRRREELIEEVHALRAPIPLIADAAGMTNDGVHRLLRRRRS